jgi:acetoin utilization protein AcuB
MFGLIENVNKEDEMIISDLMTGNPITIQQDATLRTALESMERVGCHHLPVLNQHGVLVGVISSHDCRQALNLPALVRRHWQDSKLLDRLPVSAVMTLSPEIVHEDTPAEEAIHLMLDKHIGCLPVMRGNVLVGIVTTSDLLRAFATRLERFPTLQPAGEDVLVVGHLT